MILKVITETHGIISTIVKGAKGKSKWVPEVGSLVETLPKRRGESGLYTLSYLEYIHQFSFNSLIHSAIRDSAFEITLATTHEEHPHSNLYELLGKFLHHLEGSSREEAIFSLWLFILRLGDISGFYCKRDSCCSCGLDFTLGGELVPELGGFVCSSCRPKKSALFSEQIISLLSTGSPSASIVVGALSSYDIVGVTKILVESLKSHFDVRYEIKSLKFLYEIV